MNLEGMPLNWVDLLTGIVLFVGILRGRKRGLSEEVLDTVQWIIIVIVAGLFHRELAQLIAPGSLVGQTFVNVCSYLLIVVLIKLVVTFIKRHAGEKIVGSDMFGRFEYYLGMMAGMVRFGCVYLVALSVLHAPYYTEQMLAEDARNQEKNFGDIRFPTLGGIQHTFFRQSATGWLTERHLAMVLIEPSESRAAKLRDDNSMGRRREQTVDAIMGGR
jgi:membrane protein required for colicin V production